MGFIGGGFIGQVAHLANYAKLGNCRLVGLCEARPQLRAAVQAHYGIEKTYATPEALLADPGIDAVVCITRRPNTGPLALQTLRAGKHLFTEKPMAHTVAQGQQLVEMAARAKVIYAIGYMRRHDAGIQAGKAELARVRASGELGELRSARARCFGGDSYCGISAAVTTGEPYLTGLPEWELAPEWIPPSKVQAYASFCNVFSHDLNLLRYFLEATPRVQDANLVNPSASIVTFSRGPIQATLETGQATSGQWDESIEFEFEKGAIRLELPAAFLTHAAARVEIRSSARESRVLPSSGAWAFFRQAQAFVDDVARRRTPLAAGRDALEDLKLVEEIWRVALGRAPQP